MRGLIIHLVFMGRLAAAVPEMAAHPTIPGCSETLSTESSVVGRWAGANSIVVSLRLIEALLRVPPDRIHDLLFLNSAPSHEEGMAGLLDVIGRDPALNLKRHRSNYEGHDWNYGPPEYSSEYLVVSGRPTDLAKLVFKVPAVDRVVLINPDAKVAIGVARVTRMLERKSPEISFESLVDGPLAGILSRIDGVSTLIVPPDRELRVEFAFDEVDAKGMSAFAKTMAGVGATAIRSSYLGSFDRRDGGLRSGALVAEYAGLRLARVLSLLGLFPRMRILDIRVE